MIHQMSLNPAPFDQIKKGEKIYEIRLYDEKRSKVQLGDTITFLRRPDKSKQVDVVVTEILKFENFKQMASSVPNRLIGFETNSNVTDIENCYYTYYTKQEEIKYGVVAFKIRLKN